MSSRSVRRRHHKRLSQLSQLGEDARSDNVALWLTRWRAEALRRARSLGLPMAWTLVSDPRILSLAEHLDPTGELIRDLARICAEAVKSASGTDLLGERLKRQGLERRLLAEEKVSH